MNAESSARAGRKEWMGLAVIALPCMLYSMDLTVLNLAVPQLSAALKPSSAQLLWVVDIYGFLVAPILLPEFKDPGAGRIDLASAALSLAAVLAVIYGLKHIAQNGFGWLPASIILAGLVVGYVFVRRQKTLVDPLIDLRLFRVR